jgi:hypothetical protein
MDLKFALRSLRKNPGFTLLAIVVMALGIGANTAVFSVVNAVLLKPLAYRNPDRIVTLSSLWRKSGGHGRVSAPDFHDWHDQSTAFAAMAYYADDSTSVMSGASAEYAHAAAVTPEFFQVFAVEPVAGRLFSAEELKRGARQLCVLAEPLWGECQRAGASGALVRRQFHYRRGAAAAVPLPERNRYLASGECGVFRNNIAFRAQLQRGRAAEAGRQPGAGAGADDRHRRAPGAAVQRQQRG